MNIAEMLDKGEYKMLIGNCSHCTHYVTEYADEKKQLCRDCIGKKVLNMQDPEDYKVLMSNFTKAKKETIKQIKEIEDGN